LRSGAALPEQFFLTLNTSSQALLHFFTIQEVLYPLFPFPGAQAQYHFSGSHGLRGNLMPMRLCHERMRLIPDKRGIRL
jgi:hypothetical protein